MNDNIAIAHDQFRVMGGAERVTCEIAREFDCPIYAMRVDPDVPPDDVDVRSLASRKGEWMMRRHYVIQDFFQMLSWQHMSELHDYDTIIQTKNLPYWYVPKDRQTIVRYSHSTPRGMYDQFPRNGAGPISLFTKTIQRTFMAQTRPYADAWAANSDLVARRNERYIGLDESEIDVIYPPVAVEEFGADLAETKDYLFHVGRLVGHKRIDLIVEAAKSLDTRVVIAGSGDMRDELEPESPDNVEWVGYISEEEKRRRMSEARATFFLAENEDFGIVPIESLASGTPVIGVDEGFTRNQIVHGRNGRLCDPTVASVLNETREFLSNGVAMTPGEIERETSRWFGRDLFRKQMRDLVERAQECSTVTAPWEMNREEGVEVIADGGD